MKSLDEISSIAFRRAGAVRVAVVKAADDHTLDSIVRAAHSGHVHPMLIDDEDATMRLLDGRLPEGSYEVLDVVDDSETAVLGVRLVREGYADVLMKGDLPSTTFLKPVVNRETGIRIGPVLSHVAVLESMGIGRLVVESIKMRDFPVVQGGVLYIAVVYCIMNLVVDLLYAWVDPRIKAKYR